MQDLLNVAPLVALAVGVFASLLLAGALGRRLGQGLGKPDGTEQGHVLSGILSLLALLIAFTFGLALDRYELRRELVVQEANAIGTAAMRVRLLDTPHAQLLAKTYLDYAEVRLNYGLAQYGDKPPLRKASRELRARLQAQTLEALAAIRQSDQAGYTLSAVNDSLDIGVAREAAQDARLPTAVLTALGVYAIATAVALGATLRGHRAMSTLMFLLLTLALGIIVDLDQPRAGGITVSQDAMARLVAELRATPPP